MRRLSNLGARSVRAKLLLTILPVLALAIGGLTIIAVQRVTSAQQDAVYDAAADLAGREANAFEAQAAENQSAARAVAAIGAANRSGDRGELIGQLHEMIERNKQLGGVYLAYTPNAFDGRDAANANAPGSMRDGRFPTGTA
jgi:methyl-accepting chemotaxis protein